MMRFVAADAVDLGVVISLRLAAGSRRRDPRRGVSRRRRADGRIEGRD